MASELLLTFENPVFSNFAFYVTVVVVKMMLMSLLTARQRFRKGVSLLSFLYFLSKKQNGAELARLGYHFSNFV